jgi:hypothetical protein
MDPTSAHDSSAQTSSTISNADLHEAIRRRAREIYESSGKLPGQDEQNWKQAEAEIRREYKVGPNRKAAIVVAIDGVQYTGEYVLSAADGYTPGEWSAGAPVPVRFDGEKMFLRRRNGKELETRIINKV